MLLAIDLGNTQTHIGMFRDGELVESWRLATVRETTGDELATLLVNLLELRDLHIDDVDASILSSVVPALTPEYERLAERYLSNPLLVVGPGMKTGMAIRIERPQELGTDRLANAVAAYDKCGGACVVADFGTTINFDAVSADGEYLGGVIAPGVEMSLEAPPAHRQVAGDRPGRAGVGHRPRHAPGDPVGHRLRLRRRRGR